MSGFESEATIDRPVDEVWQKLIDWKTWPAWMKGIDSCEGPEPPHPGAKLVFRARGADRESQILEFEAPRRLVLESRQGSVVAVYTYACEPSGEGTRLSLRANCEATGAMRLAMPLIRVLMKREDQGQPAALKAMLEAG